MYKIIQHSHSGLMWLAITMLIISVLFSFIKFVKKDDIVSNSWIKVFNITKWLFYIQVVLGIILLFISQKVAYGEGFMKSNEFRFYGLEHPLMMLIVVGIIAIGLYKSKKKENATQKYKIITIYYFIALLVVLFMIPWEAVLH